MASLASTDVTILDSWIEGDRSGKERVKCVRAQIDSGTAGSASNLVVPAAFGLASFFDCSPVWDATTSQILPAVVNAAGTAVYICGVATTLSPTPTDVVFDGGQTIVVKGRPA